MTSNLASDKIKENKSVLHFDEKDHTENSMQRYREASKSFLKKIYPILKEGFKRDEFLGRINQILIMLPLTEIEVNKIRWYEIWCFGLWFVLRLGGYHSWELSQNLVCTCSRATFDSVKLGSWRFVHTLYPWYRLLTGQTIVVKHLSKAYNVNFGARSLAYEVEYVVLGLVAEAVLAGKISKGCVISSNIFFNFMT